MSYKEKLIARAFLNIYIECTVVKSKVLHFYRQSVDLLKTPRKKVRTSMDIPEIVNSLKKKKRVQLIFHPIPPSNFSFYPLLDNNSS